MNNKQRYLGATVKNIIIAYNNFSMKIHCKVKFFAECFDNEALFCIYLIFFKKNVLKFGLKDLFVLYLYCNQLLTNNFTGLNHYLCFLKLVHMVLEP